jgi:hypothetical protein
MIATELRQKYVGIFRIVGVADRAKAARGGTIGACPALQGYLAWLSHVMFPGEKRAWTELEGMRGENRRRRVALCGRNSRLPHLSPSNPKLQNCVCVGRHRRRVGGGPTASKYLLVSTCVAILCNHEGGMKIIYQRRWGPLHAIPTRVSSPSPLVQFDAVAYPTVSMADTYDCDLPTLNPLLLLSLVWFMDSAVPVDAVTIRGRRLRPFPNAGCQH